MMATDLIVLHSLRSESSVNLHPFMVEIKLELYQLSYQVRVFNNHYYLQSMQLIISKCKLRS